MFIVSCVTFASTNLFMAPHVIYESQQYQVVLRRTTRHETLDPVQPGCLQPEKGDLLEDPLPTAPVGPPRPAVTLVFTL